MKISYSKLKKKRKLLYKAAKKHQSDIYKEFAKKINRSNKDYKLDHVPFMPM